MKTLIELARAGSYQKFCGRLWSLGSQDFEEVKVVLLQGSETEEDEERTCPVANSYISAVTRWLESMAKTLDVHVNVQEEHKLSKSPVHGLYDSYSCIPLDMTYFVIWFTKAVSLIEGPVRFVDAGSGIGNKVKMAWFLLPRLGKWSGSTATGVEFSKFYAKVAYEVLKVSTKLGDVTTFNFTDYNLIYAYNPLCTPDGMGDFFKNVVNTAKPGTICLFFNVYTGDEAFSAYKKHFEKLDDRIWKLKENK